LLFMNKNNHFNKIVNEVNYDDKNWLARGYDNINFDNGILIPTIIILKLIIFIMTAIMIITEYD